MAKLSFLIYLTVVLLPMRVSAATDSLLNLRELIEEVKRENPELQALREELQAAGYGVSWFRYMPDPFASVEFSDEMTMYSVTQQIPFPTKIAKRLDFAELDVDYVALLYEGKEQMLIREVKEAYADFLLLQGKISATVKSIAFLQQIHNTARQKYSVNEASQAEVLMAQVELARSENQLLNLNDDITIVAARVNTLLNRDLDMRLLLLDSLVPSVDTIPLPVLYELARTNQPRLKSSELKQKKAQLMLSMARQGYLPDMAFKYTHEMMESGMRNSKYMVGVTVPLWFWGKQDRAIHEANAIVRSAGARYEMMENAVLLDVKEAKVRLDKFRRVINLYRNSVLPQAETALKSALTGYELNRVDFHILLESEKSLVLAEYDYEEARANLFMALAELEQTIGYVD
ncbi:MAG: TolC family protein [candidate division WOR-3 bacterium]|nr:MAG: TolC family protein [candidate division WOR-3 bacterium]